VRLLPNTYLLAPAAALIPAAARAQQTAATLPGDDLTTALIKTVAGLALVLAVMLGLYWLLRRLGPGLSGTTTGGSLRLVARLGLGQRKFLALVAVADRILVLGVGPDGIRLLTTLDHPDQLAAFTSNPTPSFAGILGRKNRQQEEPK